MLHANASMSCTHTHTRTHMPRDVNETLKPETETISRLLTFSPSLRDETETFTERDRHVFRDFTLTHKSTVVGSVNQPISE